MFQFQLESCVPGVSSKDIQKARRSAKRKRAAVACSRCKAGKIKCSEYRPCKQCVILKVAHSCSNTNAGAKTSPSGETRRIDSGVLSSSAEISTYFQPPRAGYQTDTSESFLEGIVGGADRGSPKPLNLILPSAERLLKSQDIMLDSAEQSALLETDEPQTRAYGGVSASWQVSTLQYHRAFNSLGSQTIAGQQPDSQRLFPSYAFPSGMADPIAQPLAMTSLFLVPPLFTPTPPPRAFLPPAAAALLAGAGPVHCAPPPTSAALHQLLLALAAPPPAAWCRGPPS